jgi:fructan beta-fructosidase
VMVLYVGLGEKHTIHFLTSPNLRDWTLASVMAGGTNPDKFLYECPDFFELPVEENAPSKKWVLLAADSQYAIGNFDGTNFTPETPPLPGHLGKGFYAAQTFSDIPDGRRIQLGWFQVGPEGMPFHHAMTIPLELKLAATPKGPRLTWTPVREMASLRRKSHDLGALTLSPDSVNPLADLQTELVELRAGFEPGDASEVIFNVRGGTMVYDAKQQELVVNGHRAPAPLRQGKQSLIIFCDRTGLEIFASEGLTYIPMPFQPKADNLTLGLRAQGGSAKFTTLHVHELKSAWDLK